MESSDMIFSRDNKNNIKCGGYKVDNIFKKLNIPPIQGSVFPQKGGGLQNLAVPMGLFFLQQGLSSDLTCDMKDGKEVVDDLYTKLFNLAQGKKERKSKHSRKRKHKSKRQTRKNMA